MSPSAAQPPLVQPSSDARTVGQPKDRLPITAKHAIRRLTVGRACCLIKGIMLRQSHLTIVLGKSIDLD